MLNVSVGSPVVAFQSVFNSCTCDFSVVIQNATEHLLLVAFSVRHGIVLVELVLPLQGRGEGRFDVVLFIFWLIWLAFVVSLSEHFFMLWEAEAVA